MTRVVNNQSDLQIEFLSEHARCTLWSVELCKFQQLARSRINLQIGLIVDNSVDSGDSSHTIDVTRVYCTCLVVP